MKTLTILCALLLLGACSTPPRQSGLLSSYEGLGDSSNGLRSSLAERRDETALGQVRRITIAPTILAATPDNAWLEDGERTLLLREMDAQLCFELSRRYEIAGSAKDAEAQVKAVVAEVRPTGRAASAASAAAAFFIPGPIGVRIPGTTGGLTAEAEMLSPDGRQLAALVWNRDATAVGSDAPSLSRVGDALQFAEAFGDVAGKALSPRDSKSGPAPRPDPCAAFGPRLRVEGFATKFITNLYVPEASGARAAPPEPTASGKGEAPR